MRRTKEKKKKIGIVPERVTQKEKTVELSRCFNEVFHFFYYPTLHTDPQ